MSIRANIIVAYVKCNREVTLTTKTLTEPEINEDYTESFKLEEELEKQDQKNLYRLIEIRKHLWT